MRLLRIPEPFDHPYWLYEVKFDGFRALAHVNGHHCQLVSRNGRVFKSSPYLAGERSVTMAKYSGQRAYDRVRKVTSAQISTKHQTIPST
jgi:hypothetical protein